MKKRPERVLLLCNGEAPSRALLRELAQTADLIVAADGGANTARRYGIRPHVIIGDLDSAKRATLREFRESTILRVRRQDNTDMEKALEYLSPHTGARVMIVGATGGRLDFTLANLSVFWNYVPRLDISFRGDSWRAMPVMGQLDLKARVGSTVSLIPFGTCRGVTLCGLKYGLKDCPMRLGQVGVSNVASSPTFRVKVRAGRMLLIIFERPQRLHRRRLW